MVIALTNVRISQISARASSVTSTISENYLTSNNFQLQVSKSTYIGEGPINPIRPICYLFTYTYNTVRN